MKHGILPVLCLFLCGCGFSPSYMGYRQARPDAQSFAAARIGCSWHPELEAISIVPVAALAVAATEPDNRDAMTTCMAARGWDRNE